jgi:hypothetical protein
LNLCGVGSIKLLERVTVMQVTRDLLLDLNLLRELPKRVNTSAKVFAFAAHLSQRWARKPA